MNVSKASAIGLIELVQIVLFVLKLCRVIHWSWLWVLAPSWIPMALYAVAILIIVGVNHIKKWRG